MARTRGPGARCVVFRRSAFWSAAVAAAFWSHACGAWAALEITEIMFDPTNENVWEWIEIRNTSGAAVNLDGAFAARLDDSELVAPSPSIDGTLAQNTIIPAGGVAVLYDAQYGLATAPHADYLDQLFRDAWGLSASVPLVGVRAFPELVNSPPGGSTGFWEDLASYQADLVDDGMGGLKVGSFDHAEFWIDYRTGFPAGNGNSSITWDGVGDYRDGAHWQLSTVPGGATTSVLTNVPGDMGTPGIVPGGTPPMELLITEVLYNPAPATESSWEWIEIYNNTGADIDFTATPYVLDDLQGTPLSNTNVNSGLLEQGQVGVLFNGTLGVAAIEGAWDPEETRDINFISVANFPSLFNGTESIGLWPSLSAYQDPNGPRSLENAAAALTYEVGGDWPTIGGNGGPSIYLTSLDADPNQGGLNWSSSREDDSAWYVPLASVLHAGGDVGSPGTFVSVTDDANFNDDDYVDGLDFLIWQQNFGMVGGATNMQGDANGDGNVNAADLVVWETQYGLGPLQGIQGVPEPSSLGLALLAVLAGTTKGRRSAPRYLPQTRW